MSAASRRRNARRRQRIARRDRDRAITLLKNEAVAELVGPVGRTIFTGGTWKMTVAIKGFELSDEQSALITVGEV
jgi:hypothetical protein